MTLVLPRIAPLDRGAADAARAHQLTLTKPSGSLGRLEELAVWFAGVRAHFPVAPPIRGELFVFAADHGVAAEGVSAFPQAVTAAMVANFLAGGAAVNVLARQCGLRVSVVDVGVKGQEGGNGASLAPSPGGPPGDPPPGAGRPWSDVHLVSARVRSGTGNLRTQPAMSRAEAVAAIEVGLAMSSQAAARGAELLVGGEMGIANTTAAAALLCAISGDDPGETVGRGTGIDDVTLLRKAQVVRDALRLHAPHRGDPLGVLAALGGLEIAGLVGLMLGGAAQRIPTIVDGFIASAAALMAIHLAPAVRPFLLLSHVSAERGAKRLSTLLGAPAPLFDFGMRLGEGTGAVLAVPLLRAAVAAQAEMATFSAAGVPDR